MCASSGRPDTSREMARSSEGVEDGSAAAAVRTGAPSDTDPLSLPEAATADALGATAAVTGDGDVTTATAGADAGPVVGVTSAVAVNGSNSSSTWCSCDGAGSGDAMSSTSPIRGPSRPPLYVVARGPRTRPTRLARIAAG